jgi:hypothetical protein
MNRVELDWPAESLVRKMDVHFSTFHRLAIKFDHRLYGLGRPPYVAPIAPVISIVVFFILDSFR